MGFLTKTQILTKHLQMTGLVKKFAIPLPSMYIGAISLTDILNFDWSFFAYMWPELPTISFQIQFIAGCVVLPLAVMFGTLVAFLDYFYIEWFSGLLIGILMLFLAFAKRLSVDDSSPISVDDQMSGSELWLYTATAIVLVSTQAIMCRFFLPQYLLKGLSEAAKTGLRALSLTLEPVLLTCSLIIAGLPQTVVYVAMSLCGLYLAIMLRIRLVTNGMDAQLNTLWAVCMALIVGSIVYVWWKVKIDPPNQMPGSVVAFGYFQLAASGLGLLLQAFSNNSAKFQELRETLQNISDRGFLTACFFFICAAMVPVITNCLQMYMCVNFSCPEGTRFNPFVPMVEEDTYTTDSNNFCDPCNFTHSPNLNSYFDDGLGGTQLRNVCPFAAEDLCPSWSERRLLQHPDTTCETDAHPMFMAAASVSLIVFTVVINLMFYKLTRDITQTLTSSTAEKFEELKSKHSELVNDYVSKKADRDEAKMLIKFALEKKAIKKRESRKRTESGVGNNKINLRKPRRSSNERLLLGSDSDKDLPLLKEQGEDSLDAFVETGDKSPLDSTTRGGGLDHGSDDEGSEMLQMPKMVRHESSMGEFEGLDATANNVKIPLPEPTRPPPPPTSDDAFAEVCARITPKASALYSPYRFPMKYFMLIDNFHRLLLVLVTVVLAPLFGVGVFLNLAAHLAMFIILLFCSPFHDRWEQLLSLIASGCDVFNGVYVVLIWAMPDEEALTNDATVIIVSIITIAVPLVASIALFGIGMYTSWTNPYRKAEREKLEAEKKEKKAKKKARLKEIEMEKKFRKEMGCEDSVAGDDDLSKRKSVTEVMPPDPDEVKTNTIDMETKGTMLRFFLIGAVPWLVASAVVCVMAITKADPTDDNFVIGSDSGLRTQDYVLGGQYDWNAFTEHCCCFESQKPIRGFNVTERWVCSNINRNTPGFNYSQQMEAQRQTDGNPSSLFVTGVSPTRTVSKNRKGVTATGIFVSGVPVDDGIPIRSVCGNLVRSPANCSIELEDSNATENAQGSGTVVLRCNPQNYLKENWNVTETASRLLW